jgi:hypothetical protein
VRVNLEEIDPKVREALAEPLLRRWQMLCAPIWSGVRSLGFLWLIVGFLFLPFLTGVLRLPYPVALTLWLGGAAAPSLYYGYQILARRSHALREITPTQLRDAAAGLPLSPPERGYVDALAALFSAADSVGEETVRDLLPLLNETMRRNGELAVQQRRVRIAMGETNATALEEQCAALARRRDETSDPLARQALQQSLELCESRLQNLRALAPSLDRMDAQQELIVHTLASVQSALARLQAAPSALAAPNVDAIRQSVTEINQQTLAVEQAMQEVMLQPPAARLPEP